MNLMEARERFRSAARDESRIPSGITLDEAKRKFRDAAVEVDKKMGLEGQEYGAWAAALFFIALFLGTKKTQSWFVPLVTTLVSFGKKAIDQMLDRFSRTPEKKKAQKSRRAKHTPS